MAKQIKLRYDALSHIINAPAMFSELIDIVHTVFSCTLSDSYKIYYNDSDDDLIIVTSQEDYELALAQEVPLLTFYVSERTEKAHQLMNGQFSPVQSLCLEAEDHSMQLYACLGCNGMKTNKKGTKVCRLCAGTGKIPEEFLEKVRSIIRTKLQDEFEPQFIQAASELIERRKNRSLEMSKAAGASPTYKIATSSKEENFSCQIVHEIPKDDLTVKLGEDFYKKWIMKNTGNNPWPSDTIFKCINEEKIQATISHVGKVESGETVEIRLKGKAPNEAGRYLAYYRLIYGNGNHFGAKPWLDLTVTK